MKPSDIPEERHYKRVLRDNIVYWEKTYDISCYICGKRERMKAIIVEGEYKPEYEHKTIDQTTGEEKIIYPIFAPNSSRIDKWEIPDGWTQSIHLTNEFYPHETLQAIHLNLEQVWRLLQIRASEINWVDLVANGGYKVELRRTRFLQNPYLWLHDILIPKIANITFDKEMLAKQLHFVWHDSWTRAGKQFISPKLAFEMWYEHTNKQFAQWLCPNLDCHIENTKLNYNEMAKYCKLEPAEVKVG